MPCFHIERVSTSHLYKDVTHALVVTLDADETLSDEVIRMIDTLYTESIMFMKRTRQPLKITCSMNAFASFRALKYISFHCVVDWHVGLERLFDSCERLTLLQICGKTCNTEVQATSRLINIQYLLLNGYGIVNGFGNVIENIERNGGYVLSFA